MRNNKLMKMKKISAMILVAALMVSNTSMLSFATGTDSEATGTDSVVTTDEIATMSLEDGSTSSTTIKTISINMGAEKSEMIFTWLDTSEETSSVKVTTPDGEKVVEATKTDYTSAIGYYSYTATVDCFAEVYDYAYQVGNDVDGWSEVDYITVNDATDDGSYTFIAAGDPQIGSSNATTDGEGWAQTLAYATEWFGDDIDFLVSVGDQVNASNSGYAESEYDAYFTADLLTSIPSSVVAGNHEIYSYSTYSAHYTAPDTVDSATVSTVAGDESGDYWYAYEGTLFLCLNSNVTSTALHYDFIQNAIAEYKAEYGEVPTWQIVTFHHSIFSSASHYDDTDILERQSTWADMFSDFDIDVVLMGHDHVYTRSVMMQGMNPTEYSDNSMGDVTDYVMDPNDGEVLYVTLNSASGSKYYSIQNYELDYVAVKDQTNTPTITKVEVTDESLVISTYYTDGDSAGELVDEFSIIRETTTNSTDKPEVVEGETYDDIHAPELTVPSDNTIYVGDTYDVMDGVSATDIDYYYDYFYDYTTDDDPTYYLTDKIVVVGEVDTTTAGVYKVNYYVTDGVHTTADSVTVTVKEGLTLIDENTEWTAIDGGYEATFTFDGDITDYESVIGAYTTSATTTVYINGIQVAAYTVSSGGRAPTTSSASAQTFTITDLSVITEGENTITVTTTASDFEFTSLIAEKSLDTSGVMDYTFYPAIAIDSVEGEYNDAEDTILNVDTISGFSIGGSDEDGGLVEIVCYNTEAQVAYVSSGSTDEIIVIPMTSLTTSGLSGYGYNMADIVNEFDGFEYGDISSVAVSSDGKYLAVAVQHDTYTENGVVLIFELDANGNILADPEVVECGVQPDSLTFTPDGSKILVANEGEPREGYGDGVEDPEGSVTIINVADFSSNTVNFDGVYYDDQVLLKTGSTPSEDFEPEYIATTNTVAYVALQENNAIAVLDLTTGTFTGVYGLGLIDYSEVAIDIVADEVVNDTTTYENLYGILMPDGISVYEIDGKTYLYTANEGDGREWGDGENEYVNEYKSKTSLTGNIELEEKVTWFNPEDYTMLNQDADYLFGGRSFSIFEVTEDGLVSVYNSANEFSDIVAETFEEYYNCSNDDISVEDRAGKKGVEPEYTVVGEVDGQIYAFTGLERQGGIMVYNVTDPTNVTFVNYINSRDYSSDIAGDVAPEGLAFVSASDSATGNALLLVANEVSGTMSVIELTENTLYVAPTVDDAGTGDDAGTEDDTSTEDDASTGDDAGTEDDASTGDDAGTEDDASTEDDTTDTDGVDTGDHANVFWYVALMLCTMAGMLVVAYKKAKSQE